MCPADPSNNILHFFSETFAGNAAHRICPRASVSPARERILDFPQSNRFFAHDGSGLPLWAGFQRCAEMISSSIRFAEIPGTRRCNRLTVKTQGQAYGGGWFSEIPAEWLLWRCSSVGAEVTDCLRGLRERFGRGVVDAAVCSVEGVTEADGGPLRRVRGCFCASIGIGAGGWRLRYSCT